MYVQELQTKLKDMPADCWVDVMFTDGSECYQIGNVSLIELSQGEQRVIVDIVNEVPLRAV
jgi:hypothetical protein